jgi:hypothetical protein
MEDPRLDRRAVGRLSVGGKIAIALIDPGRGLANSQ